LTKKIKMKIVLFALVVLAFARGLELQDSSSMRAVFNNERDERNIGCGGPPPRPRNLCHGFAEIRTEFNGTETVHGRLIQEGAIPKKANLLYRVPGGRNARKIIEVQGDCCWEFYRRFHYRGNLKRVSNSGRIIPSFAPRSLKVVEC